MRARSQSSVRGGSGTSTNIGIDIAGPNTLVTSVVGNILIDGLGGNGSANFNPGVFLVDGGQVTSTGTDENAAFITIIGAGGSGTDSNFGVEIAGLNALVTSVIGDIEITGQGGAGSANFNPGVFLVDGGQVTSTGTGVDAANITITGTGGTGTSDLEGVLLQNGNSRITSVDGDIQITGQGGNGSSSVNPGVFLLNGGQVTSTGTGNSAAAITINGTGGTGTSDLEGVLLQNANSRITSEDGDIQITGQGGNGSSSVNPGVFLLNGGQVTSTGNIAGAGTITIIGTGGGGTDSNAGVEIAGLNALVSSVIGNIEITGQGGAGSANSNTGVYLLDGGQVTSSGTGENAANVTITGSGGTGTSRLDGVMLRNANSRITAVDGDIQVTGQGGNGSRDFNTGVLLADGGQVTSTGNVAGAGTVTIIGTGGGGTDSNYGVYIGGLDSLVASVVGNLQITGTATSTGTSHFGVRIAGYADVVSSGSANVQITATGGAGGINAFFIDNFARTSIDTSAGTGSLTVIADSVSIGTSNASLNAGTNMVTLRQKTNGTRINIGGNDFPDTNKILGLTDAELDRITAGTLQIGDANSGAITVSAAITRTIPTNVNLTTGGNNSLTFSGVGSLDANGGDVTVSLNGAGSGRVVSGTATTDILADDLSITAGSAGIGASGNPLTMSVTTLTTDTNDATDGAQFLSELNSLTIAANDLDTGTAEITLKGGTFLTSTTGSILSGVTVASGATLGGTGTTGAVTVQSGGSVAPGNSPGILNSGNVTFDNDSNFNVEINGMAGAGVAGGHDQVNVTGSVTLNGGTLNVTLGYTPTHGDSFTIINNDGSDAVMGSGTLKVGGVSIFNGGTFIAGGNSFVINYSAGANNNGVVLVSDAAPVITSSATPSIAENTSVVPLTVTDVDLDTVTLSITGGTDAAKFEIVNSVLQFKTAPDFENRTDSNADNIFEVQVQADDGYQGLATQTIQVTITDMNDVTPVVTSGQSFSLAENSPATTAVGTVLATDGDVAATTFQSWTITAGNTDKDGDLTLPFAINASTGEITVNDAGDLDRERTVSFTLSMTVSDGVHTSSAQTLTINVTNVNETPTDMVLSADSLAENNAANATVGTLSASDLDASNTFTFSLVAGSGDTDNASFTLAGNALKITPVTDFETKSSYAILVQVADQGELTFVKQFTINVTDVNDVTSVVTSAQGFNVAENSAAATIVGTVLATDGDVTATTFQSWTITAGNTDKDGDTVRPFAIDASTGEITVNDAGDLDREQTASFTLSVTVSDGVHTSAAQTVTINLTDVNDVTPVVTASQSFSVAENSAATTAVGTVLATDGDVTSTTFQSWMITAGNTDNDGDSTLPFVINASTGAITVNDAGDLNREQTASFALSVTVSDGVDTSAAQTVTISVTNVNETPTLVNAVLAQDATVGSAFSVTLPANTFADVDVGDSLALSAAKSDGSVLPTWLTFNATTHKFTGTPTNTNLGTVSVKVTATDTSNASASSTFILTVVTDIAYAATGSAVLTTAVVNNRLQVKLNNVTDTRFDSLDPAFIRSITLTGGTGADSIKLTGLSSSTYSRLTRVSLNGGGGNDAIVGSNFDETISGGLGNDSLNGAGGTNTLSESGNVNFTLTNTSLVGVGTDTLANLQVANLTGGTSTNTFTVSGWTRAGTLVGGGGTGDTIVASKNVNFTLSNSVLQTTDGMNLSLNGFTKATLTGGTGSNSFTVGGWTGTGTLTGGTGTDTLSATRNASTTLTTTSLAATGFGTLTLSSLEAAQLTGGDGNNLFTVTGWNGTGSVTGGGGTDTIVATRNANVTLSDTQLLASNGLTMTLSGMSIANLTGGTSANTFTVSGWSGSGKMDGSTSATGTFDQIVAVRDTDMTLTNTSLAAAGFGTLTLAGIESANLNGGASANKLIAKLFTLGAVTLQGNGGDDALIGGLKNDSLLGGAGRDTIIGGAGNDTLRGGDDDDTLIGGLGVDSVFGDSGADFGLGGRGGTARGGTGVKDTGDNLNVSVETINEAFATIFSFE